MTIEEQIQDVVDSISTLAKYVKTHQGATVDYETLDDLERATADLQEVTYELEARVSDDQMDSLELSDEN
jgi:hypothetical protein